MTTSIKLILAVLMIAIVATGAYHLATSPTGDPVVSGDGPAIPDPKLTPSTPDEKRADPTAKRDTPDEKGDTAMSRTKIDPAAIAKNFEQGVHGKVVDEFGNAVANAEVYLMPGMGIKVMEMYRLHQQGVRFPPVAHSTTGADGVFRLGVEKWDGSQYEVRTRHPDYCDAVLPNVVPQPSSWVDAVLKLKKGVRVFGRVSTESGLPIGNATVTLRDNSGQINLAPMPGREHGLTTLTDQTGAYELPHVDAEGIYAMSAIADDYAKEEKTELQFKDAEHHQHDFKLAPGLEIAGTVTNTQGKPIAGATLMVSALSQKSRIMENAKTNDEGYFIVQGLRAGPYAVQVVAEGYQKIDDKPVKAGTKTLEYTMEQQGRLLITVLGANGQPLSNFHCNLKTAFDGQATYGNTVLGKAVKGARNGTAEIAGINPMTYVAEIFADGYAKNFSDRFTITESQTEPQRVTVQLNRGGTIAGTITDNQGKPIPGVKVLTRPHGMIDNKFLEIFPIPYTITRRDGKTDQNGRFEFTLLYPGKYQLKLEHPHYCTDFVKDVVVAMDQRVDLNELKLTRGCLVSGITSIEGQPRGQIKVTVSSVADPENPVPFSAEAISDNEGKFLLDKRLRPGRYEVMAANNAQPNPLIVMMQFQKSKREIFVAANRELFEIRIEVPKIN